MSAAVGRRDGSSVRIRHRRCAPWQRTLTRRLVVSAPA